MREYTPIRATLKPFSDLNSLSASISSFGLTFTQSAQAEKSIVIITQALKIRILNMTFLFN